MDGSRRPVALICGVDPMGLPGGHPSYVRAHGLAARAAGFEPHIFCVAERASVAAAEFGIVHRVRSARRHFLLAPVFHREVASAAADFLAGCGHPPPHLIHGFGLWAACAVECADGLARRGIDAVPIASSYTTVDHEWRAVLRSPRAHGDLRASLWYAAWYPWVRSGVARTERDGYRRARMLLVNYEHVAGLLRRVHGAELPIRRISYAPPAAFGPPADGHAAGERQIPLILTVSRHDARKGLDVLLRALHRLARLGVEFRACLVGPGRLLGAHQQMVHRLGLQGRVELTGYVEDVTPYLHDADVFVLPSLQEGSGSLSLLEALCAGVAIIASRCDGIPEDIEHETHGLLVDPGDERALADALRRLLADPGLRARLAGRGRELATARFGAGEFTRALGEVYAEVLATC